MAIDDTLRPGSNGWARFYLLVIAVHVLVLLGLWWFTESYNVPEAP